METYNLFIRRYGRSLDFDTIEELRDEVKQYFTKREIESGILTRLTTFCEANRKDGMVENHYKDFTVTSYKWED